MIRRSESLIVTQTIRLLLPCIMIFALYIIGHGHYSPGGGFQGGVLLASAAMLLRLTLGSQPSERLAPASTLPLFGAAGILVFIGTGVPALLRDRAFLDYGAWPLTNFLDSASIRSYGILVVETGVGLGVYALLVSLFDNLNSDSGAKS